MAETHDEPVAKLALGYNRIARDLDRAIRVSRMSIQQQFLLGEAREASWTRAAIQGSPKSLPFRLNISDLARCSGYERTSLVRSFSALVAARIFMRLPDGTHLINKDYRLWLSEDGTPMLRAEQIDWCLSLRKRPGRAVPIGRISDPGVAEQSQGVAEQSQGGVAEQSQEVLLNSHTPCCQIVTPPAPAPPYPPVGERASERISDRFEEQQQHNSRGAAADAPPPGPKADPKLAALVAWGEKALADAGADEFVIDDFSQKASAWLSEGYPAAVIKGFVSKAIQSGAIDGLRFARFVHGCLAKWRPSEGRPLPPAPKAPAPRFHTARPRTDRNGETEGGAR